MIHYAEQFDTMPQAKARWAILEERWQRHPKSEGLLTTAWLNGKPHVLLVAVDLPHDFLDHPTGRVHQDIHPGVWLKLWLRHEERRPYGGTERIVIRRPEDAGIRL